MKRDAKDYANENVVQTVKVIEALEGANFEAVSISEVIERVGVIAGSEEPMKYDKVMRILLTLELLGWVQQEQTKTKTKKWLLGSRILRFSNRYSEICIAALNK